MVSDGCFENLWELWVHGGLRSNQPSWAIASMISLISPRYWSRICHWPCEILEESSEVCDEVAWSRSRSLAKAGFFWCMQIVLGMTDELLIYIDLHDSCIFMSCHINKITTIGTIELFTWTMKLLIYLNYWRHLVTIFELLKFGFWDKSQRLLCEDCVRDMLSYGIMGTGWCLHRSHRHTTRDHQGPCWKYT